MTLTDSIERILELNATPDKVWPAIATKAGVTSWFCDTIEGDWAPGETVTMKWGEFANPVQVVSVDPKTLVSYRWVPGMPSEEVPFVPDNLTLVEFHLSANGTGSRLRLVETGFSRLPREHWERCLSDNTAGWDEELQKLAKLFA